MTGINEVHARIKMLKVADIATNAMIDIAEKLRLEPEVALNWSLMF
jgi:hypothetical protein